MKWCDLTIVIPVYNEEAALQTFCNELAPLAIAEGARVILVDDGSTDRSYSICQEIAISNGWTVLHHKINRGYGAALSTGFAHVQTSLCVSMDADGQHNPSEIYTMLEALDSNDADLVIGNRGKLHGGNFRSSGRSIIRFIAKLLMEVPISDLNSGMKLYRTTLVQQYLAYCPDSMAFSDFLTLFFINQRHVVIETSISIRPRLAGTSSIGVHTAVETVYEILNLIMLFNPIKIFLPIACLFIFAGFGWGLPLVIAGRGVSTGAGVSIMMGVLIFLIGLVAEQLSIRHRLLFKVTSAHNQNDSK